MFGVLETQKSNTRRCSSSKFFVNLCSKSLEKIVIRCNTISKVNFTKVFRSNYCRINEIKTYYAYWKLSQRNLCNLEGRWSNELQMAPNESSKINFATLIYPRHSSIFFTVSSEFPRSYFAIKWILILLRMNLFYQILFVRSLSGGFLGFSKYLAHAINVFIGPIDGKIQVIVLVYNKFTISFVLKRLNLSHFGIHIENLDKLTEIFLIWWWC